jgi:hypothetical protein
MRSPIVATALLAPMPRKPTPPKAPALFAQAFALLPFPTRTVRKPQAAVLLATIKESTTDEIAEPRRGWLSFA